MKQTIRGFLSLAMACAIAATSLAVAAVARCRAFKNLLVDTFLSLATPQPDQPHAVSYARAKAFVQRIARRERVVLTSSWRMCPSI